MTDNEGRPVYSYYLVEGGGVAPLPIPPRAPTCQIHEMQLAGELSRADLRPHVVPDLVEHLDHGAVHGEGEDGVGA